VAEQPGQPARPTPHDAWVLATLPQAMAYATSLLRDREAAEDVVHDCYCRLLRKADVYDLERDGMKLLVRSIANACIDLKGRRRVLASLDQLTEAAGTPAELADGRAADPPAEVVTRELSQVIEDGLSRLPLAQRAALEMKSLGCSLQEIAADLGIGVSHAGVLIHRARQAMARHLAPYVGDARL
jgi:RNA polymerase sigma factor (sigma-70 family)